jgi:hypothetical protein
MLTHISASPCAALIDVVLQTLEVPRGAQLLPIINVPDIARAELRTPIRVRPEGPPAHVFGASSHSHAALLPVISNGPSGCRPYA